MPTHTLITEKKKKKEAAGVADAHFVFALPNASSTANEISLEQDEWVVTQSSAQSKRFDEERKKKKKGQERHERIHSLKTLPVPSGGPPFSS